MMWEYEMYLAIGVWASTRHGIAGSRGVAGMAFAKSTIRHEPIETARIMQALEWRNGKGHQPVLALGA